MGEREETVTIFGAGRSGVAAARFLSARGWRVRLTDAAVAADLPYAAQLDPGIETVFGGHPEEILDQTDLVVLSPGIPDTIAPIVEAKRRGIPVISEIELAFRHLEGTVVAITGSNGKSTTTALVGHLLTLAGHEPIVAGNIGRPLSSVIEPDRERVYVVELSSFQLETVESFRADVAVLLNVTPDHMDRYESFEEYAAAKYRIFGGQTEEDVAILNAEDQTCRNAPTSGSVRMFSVVAPQRPGAWKEGEALSIDATFEGEILRSELALEGDSNVENALAAWLVVDALDVPVEIVAEGFATFRGLPHRMELVGLSGGVRWINDSKGTNVDATLKSLSGLPERSVILILGGRDKGSDFTRLRAVISERVRMVLLIGEASAKIASALEGVSTEIREEGDLESAVRVASDQAEEGDVVLLSPACASFDQYENFERRGDHFRGLVRAMEGAA